MSSEHFDPGLGEETRRAMVDVEEVAAEWIARRNSRRFTADEQLSLNAWLEADVRNAEAFDAMSSTWSLLRGSGRVRPTQPIAAQRSAPRRKVYAFACAGLAAALVLAAWTFRAWLPVERVAVAAVAVRPDLRTLPDGSTVELNLGADIAVAFTREERVVRLLRGEALFDVTKDPARPFVVRAGTVAVRAVGTAFTVRHDEEHINVLVTEGKVAVDRMDTRDGAGASDETGADRASAVDASPASLRPAPQSREPVYVEVGRQIAIPVADELPALRIEPVSAEQIAAALAWRSKRIEFNDARLPEVIALFNRQNTLQLQISGAALLKRSITGVFWSDDPEGFVRLLESGFGVTAQREGDTIRISGE